MSFFPIISYSIFSRFVPRKARNKLTKFTKLTEDQLPEEKQMLNNIRRRLSRIGDPIPVPLTAEPTREAMN